MARVKTRVRQVRPEDIDFITSSWLQSYRTGGCMVESVPNSIYFRQHHRLLEKLIPESVVLIACNDEDDEQIFGWICAQIVDNFLCIHYLYVKDSFRRFGIAEELVRLLMQTQPVDQTLILTTHQTRKVRAMQTSDRQIKKVRIQYSPYLLFMLLDGSKWWV